MRILITGSAGFIGSYVVGEFLAAGWEVVGLDNFSKYGELRPAHAGHPRYTFVTGGAKETRLVRELLSGCDHFVAGAAMIGGIAYFHRFAFDLLAENERLQRRIAAGTGPADTAIDGLALAPAGASS